MAKKPSGLGKGFDNIFYDNTVDERGNLTKLRLSLIEPKADQPRKIFEGEALAELADSIAAHGVLQPRTGNRRRPLSDHCRRAPFPCLQNGRSDRNSGDYFR